MNYIFSDECERLATELIEKYHEHLRGIKIAYIFKAKKPTVELENTNTSGQPLGTRKRGRGRPAKAGKKVWIAKCSLVNGKYRLLFDKDYRFIITADEEIWETLDEKQKLAVMDHELCHAVFDEDGNARLRKHDLEEFRQTVDRHGLFLPDILAFYEACKRGKERTNNE